MNKKEKYQTKMIAPDSFAPEKHWYPKALNAQIHPLVRFFLKMTPERIISRYIHLHPMVTQEQLNNLLTYTPRALAWAGTDLLHVTSAEGQRQMVVIETNSCPSGQKSMPLVDEHKEQGGYRQLIERVFKPRLLARRKLPNGGLAVLYDKNEMEAGGYASAMADSFNEPVYLVPAYQDDDDPSFRFEDGVLVIRDETGTWRPIRAAFRYVTQRPWSRIPVQTRTLIFNPTIACLAGGRNKMVGAKAYDFFNAEHADSGLQILTPETIWDVSKAEIPLWVNRMGGQAVVKVPYSNAGQGVYTIVSAAELDTFMALDFHYDRFIVQSLVGNYHWSSTSQQGKLYHVGTIPDLRSHSYVADLRMMIGATAAGYRPIALYARRAHAPLVDTIKNSADSWSILGTNLSFKNEDGSWNSETERLLLMDHRDFNRLGVGLDDLIDGYIQTVMAAVAIDQMAYQLTNSKGGLRTKLFRSLNDDSALVEEIVR